MLPITNGPHPVEYIPRELIRSIFLKRKDWHNPVTLWEAEQQTQ